MSHDFSTVNSLIHRNWRWCLCLVLAPVYHQLSLEHGHHKQSSPPHHTSLAVCFY
ncbi:hypothetical protein GBAR_LOCUS15430 [Geodia barretti]|uniref:Uncharacterized protein n=1 Tax=Geodia barretti TaxID=519541 RepID=A0AA35SBG2_GEOBA|nr:hypothetical protein GBAR_LOCUS15430 [Geodia barretti]